MISLIAVEGQIAFFDKNGLLHKVYQFKCLVYQTFYVLLNSQIELE
jgi:hypothetical protein